MIYVLKAPAYLCKALGSLCAVLTKGCEGCAAQFEAFMGACAREFGDVCAGLFGFIGVGLGAVCELTSAAIVGLCRLLRSVIRIEGELGGLVLLSLVLNVPSLISAAGAAGDPQVKQCTRAALASFCREDAILAAAHLAFAIYFKCRVDAALYDPGAGVGEGEAAAAPPRLSGREARRLVREQVRALALFDIGVAIYFFVFCYSVWFNGKGFSMVHVCKPDSWASWNAPALQMAYAFFAVQYAICWSCFQAARDRMETVIFGERQKTVLGRLLGPPGGATASAPPGPTVGMPPPPPPTTTTDYVRAPNNALGTMPVPTVTMPAPSAPPGK